VRDALGRKMSKSLGNGIDPLEIIDQYGADALRFTLATGNSPGNDMRFSDEKVSASRNFANKLWNAARYVLMNLDEDTPAPHIPENLTIEDKWVLSKFNTLVKDVTDNLEKFELGLAVAKLYDFIWDVYCDWYIEISKIRLQKGGDEARSAKDVLVYVLSNTLKLLHPFMPFITEEIWQTLPHKGESIMISSWPEFSEELCFEQEESKMEKIMEAIRAIRNRRAEMNVPPSRKAKYYITADDKDAFRSAGIFMQRLASASEVELGDSFDIEGAVSIVTAHAKIHIPMGELIDFEAEKARLNKEKEKALKELEFISKKLNNPGFVSKAPEAVVQGQRDAAAKLQDKISMLEDSIAKLG
ncbi:MAG: class I tRNA ligase family protein, partial [Clostridia bacterium]|nr:class I tRNA ligase family protein [Clostridia bacterium]